MEIMIGILAAWGGVMLAWTLIGVMLLPLSRRSEIRLTVVLRGEGDAPRLEQYLKGLLWLRNMGLLWWDVIILDDDLTPEAKKRALYLIQKEVHSVVISAEELRDWMER